MFMAETQQEKKDNSYLFKQYEVPGDINLAWQHRKSCDVGPRILGSGICRSSNRYIGRKKLSIFCDTEELEFMGPGVPLYFQFMRNCMWMLATTFIIQSIYSLYEYANGNNCKTLDEIKANYPQLSTINEADVLVELTKSDYSKVCVASSFTTYS